MIIKSPPGKRRYYLEALERAKAGLERSGHGRCLVAADVNPYTIWRN
jgi:hypothetical protein